MSSSASLQKNLAQAVALHRAGRPADAERLYRQVLERDPSHEQALFLTGAIALTTNRANEAVALLERLVEARPDNAVYFTNLGEAYRRLGNYDKAASTLVKAITLRPDLAQAHFNLGLVLRKRADLPTAIDAFARAATLKPDEAQIQHTLALALVDHGEHLRAIGHFQCALLLNPKAVELLVDYSKCLRGSGSYDAALLQANRAIELTPNNAFAHHERSAVLIELERLDEALVSSERAVALDPKLAMAHCGLASALSLTGRLDEAIAAYRAAIALDPADDLAHSNLVFLQAFRPGSTAQTVLDEARAWVARHAAPLAEHHKPHRNQPDPARKLRIGYVSSNFNGHCQSLFVLPLLEQHDRSQFELFGFSNTARPDPTTTQIRDQFEHWHDLSRLDPQQAAARIQAESIDILIDLTMHMSVSQLRIFACKPAPVQIAWLAYPGTTGLSEMDYRVTDRHLDPPELPAGPYSEASLVLPDTFWCYRPPETEPVSALPALTNGYVTFGWLNSFWKLNAATLRTWAKVMQCVATSRLLLLAPSGSARSRVLETLAEAGIASDRVELVARRPRLDYLKLYHRVDIGLDALPYNGHTTSLDAFWMGVPVVTLVGSTIVGRAGLCQAQNLGLPELIAHTETELVAAAAKLSEDLSGLSQLRAGMRERLQRSPLMDAERFARNLEAKYQEAWRRWCEERAADS